jgi:hypothetical protein
MSFGNVNDVCKTPTYLNAIDQRRRLQLLAPTANIIPRYNNLDANPYVKRNPVTGLLFTTDDISMRRKAEILSYNSLKSSTQTNNLTKRQKWAQLVRNKQISQSFIQKNTQPNGQVSLPVCPPTPSTSCNIPGPVVYLSKDPAVPLYNYLNNVLNAPYSIQVPPVNTNIFNFSAITDSYCATSALTNYQYASCSTIYLIKPIEPRYTFSMNIPLCVYVEADVSYNGIQTQYTDPSAVSIWLSTASIQVNYSTSPVTLLSTPTYSLSGDYTTNHPMTLAVNDMTIYPPTNIQSQNPDENRFFAYAYFGTLHVSNVVLPCEPNYIYDITLALDFNAQTSADYGTYFGSSYPKIAAYINPSLATCQLPPQKCNIHPPPTQFVEATLPKFGISISGQS